MKELLGDGALRASLADEGRLSVATAFSAQRMVRDIEEIYCLCLAQATRSADA
jgi:hypothetical protein